MENVPEVIGTKNIKHFAEWIKTLDELGYKSKWQLLNGKDYAIPQNRNRCFMVSVLGDYYYNFPQPFKTELRLKDMLEDKVDEKYYLSDKTVEMFVGHTLKQQAKGNGFKFEPTDGGGYAHSVLTRNGERTCDNFIKCEQVAQITSKGFTEMTGRVYSEKGLSPSIRTFAGGNTEVKIMEEPEIIQRPHGYNQGAELKDCPSITVSSWQENNLLKEPNLKTKMCNDLLEKGLVKDGDVIRHSYTKSRMNGEMKDIKENNMCPTLDTRADCLGVCINYRIRKLTPKECFRLMGVKDEDYEKVAKNQSNSSLYHLAGDSIIVNVLMVIFGKMFD